MARATEADPQTAGAPVVVVIDHGVHGDVALERTVLEPLGFRVVDTRAEGMGVEEGFRLAVESGAVAIVAGIVAAHRGEVKAENAPGGGARFVVRLPAEGGATTR